LCEARGEGLNVGRDQMIRRNWRAILIVIAIFIDILAIALSGAIAYAIRSFIPNLPDLPASVFHRLGILFGSTLIVFAMLVGVYRATFHSNTIRQYFLAGKAYVYGALVVFSLLFLLQYKDFPRKFSLLFFFIVPFVFVFLRTLLGRFIKYMQGRGYGIHNAVLAGYDNGGMAIIKRFDNFPELGYNIKGIITNQKKSGLTATEIHGKLVPRYSLNHLEHVITESHIDRVFIPSTNVVLNGYSEVLETCRKKDVKLKVLSEDSDRLLRLARVYDIAGITLVSSQRIRIDALKHFIKRIFDILVASSALLFISPILIVTTLAIYMESGRPIFFKQRRSAIKGSKIFNFYKFRSMVKNADELKDTLVGLNECDGALFKIKNDPRMTKVGKFIRKLSIDELPQLLNVLKGDMSIVGPRPLPVGDFDKVRETAEYWKSIKDRAKVKPGITGLWQISGRSALGFREMISLDLYYVENQSLLFDLEILFATVPVVLFGKGAY
jgi:exopolysaccharide biosynthesis polyprenyl glycosylphosphotransferase